MWPPLRFDISPSDLAAGLAHCFSLAGRQTLAERIEADWSADGDALACLSVRSGFDLLLRALDLPRGSEVLFSALTIPDMPRIAEHHGLRPVPVDVDVDTLHVDCDALQRAITPNSRAVVVAHLFGSRMPLEPILETARAHNLLVIEDCAQAYAGPEFRGHWQADAVLFSFGPLKTATALGGAVVTVRDRDLRRQMYRLHAEYPAQSRPAFGLRVLKYAVLQAASVPFVFGGLVRTVRFLAGDRDEMLHGLVRGFAEDDLIRRIRRRPSFPLLAILRRRLRTFDAIRFDRRVDKGRHLLRLLRQRVSVPGAEADPHSFWVFPVLVDDPQRSLRNLRRAGFHATPGQSLNVVEAPPDRPDLDPQEARRLLAETVFLPFSPEMPVAELERMADVLMETTTPAGHPA